MEFSSIEWWHWLAAGFVLLALELVTPGALFLIFFGAAAIVVGLLSAAGLAGPLATQVFLFAALSLAALFSLRRMLMARLHPRHLSRAVGDLVGETAVALEELPIDGMGKAELHGSTWSARNVGLSVLAAGQRCTVVRIEGLTLWVSAD
ncbi:MAG: NfeD family protein [Chloroflexi bacterium]|nr:NfeD family protein [Chloroflexota bacterium]